MELLSDAGLLAITVPKTYGGAGVRARTVARVIAALSRADGSIGQIPQNHFFMLEGLRLQGSEEQKRFFYGRVLAGERLGNALSETGTKTAHDHATRLSRDGSIYRLNGRKFYSTGVLFAHWVAVVANDENNVSTIAFVPRDTKGITIVDDWSGFGQRTTGSGTTLLDNVEVHPLRRFVVRRFVRASDLDGAVRTDHARRSRTGHRRGGARRHGSVRSPLRSPGQGCACRPGERRPLHGRDGWRIEDQSRRFERIARSGRRVLSTGRPPNPRPSRSRRRPSRSPRSRSLRRRAALLVTSKLIELAGSSATLTKHGLDRHWRNARTHTVHDPVRWKYRAVGDYWLNGVNPPRHGAI